MDQFKMKEKPVLAVWHNFPSGGGKHCLAEELKRLSKYYLLELYTTELVDDTIFPLEQNCQKVTKYPVPTNPYFGIRKICWKWVQMGKIFKVNQQAAKDINNSLAEKVFVNSCMLEQAPSLLRFLKKPSVYYCHEPLREYYEGGDKATTFKARVGKWLAWPELYRRHLRDRAAILAADALLVNSKFIHEQVKRIYHRESQVCYLGVDTDFFQPGLSGGDYFLSVGRLSQIKGHDFVLEVLGRLPNMYRKLEIVADSGSSKEVQRLQDLAKAKGVKLKINQKISDLELLKLYQGAKAVICGQRHEPFGFVPLEAGACGVPVFVVSEGGFRESVVDGVNGFWIPREPKEAAKIIQETLSDLNRSVYAQKAIAWTREKWSWQTHVEALRKVIEEVRKA
jgi:glycosyltransferase involved in cell wall biosynthesis